LFLLFCAEVTCHKHVCAHTQPHEQLNNKVYQRVCCRNRSDGVGGTELSANNKVGGIVQQLQYAGKYYRKRKHQYLFEKISRCHVNFVFTYFGNHNCSLTNKTIIYPITFL